MGEDKALLDWKGKPLARHIAERLGPLFESTVISGDPKRYGRLGIRCIPDLGGAGPLAGLFATLLEAKTAAIFAIACDMPFAEPEAALEMWKRLPGFDAAVPVSGGGPEPLHAFYLKRALPAVGRALEGKGRMTGWWGECRIARVPAGRLPGGERGMADCDTPAEWHSLKGGR
jgi:molybdopterin-guanine dinucleotide biosynthesis protein A